MIIIYGIFTLSLMPFLLLLFAIACGIFFRIGKTKQYTRKSQLTAPENEFSQSLRLHISALHQGLVANYGTSTKMGKIPLGIPCTM